MDIDIEIDLIERRYQFSRRSENPYGSVYNQRKAIELLEDMLEEIKKTLGKSEE
ncbi:hypothetical protein [Actinopolyspora erythraea]|uniref:hypothetical protein n=1 Tax=Actinopolyspora erythraea TaxID=414996 RepID=UPI0012B6243A|nr:hypothetical protein [Actinopolyspora erythraea]